MVKRVTNGEKKAKDVDTSTRKSKKMKKCSASEMLEKVQSAVPATVSESQALTNERKKETRLKNGIAGFIFMCSRKTKPECYQYRVFGLPAAKLEDVQTISEGTKLYLYDFNVKLLYGIYEATSGGGKSLEPDAFGGGFPAQVKFKIFKHCMPLPESVFSNALKENYYEKGKFRPELSDEQVNRLSALFCQLPEPEAGPAASIIPDQQTAASQLPHPASPYVTAKPRFTGAPRRRPFRRIVPVVTPANSSYFSTRYALPSVVESLQYPPLDQHPRNHYEVGRPHIQYSTPLAHIQQVYVPENWPVEDPYDRCTPVRGMNLMYPPLAIEGRPPLSGTSVSLPQLAIQGGRYVQPSLQRNVHPIYVTRYRGFGA